MAGQVPRKYAENRAAIEQGLKTALGHPLIRPTPGFDLVYRDVALALAPQEWVRIVCRAPVQWMHSGIEPEPQMTVWPNLRKRALPSEWAYAFARLCLHIVLGHIDPARREIGWHMACWLKAEEMVAVAGVGSRPADRAALPSGLPQGDEAALAERFAQSPAPGALADLSLGLPGQPFWTFAEPFTLSDKLRQQRAGQLASGIRAAASQAVDIAGGARKALGSGRTRETLVRRAFNWVISEYPLLAALASSFELIEDEQICENLRIEVAAISDAVQEVYVNPRVSFTEDEARFVMAHELLHAGLRHTERRQGRDPWLWNIACDYVINDWLIEMQVGAPPEALGYMHDIDLRGQSAEEIYARIVADLRWKRKLKKARTLNGTRVDLIEDRPPGWWRGGGVDLDAFYRRALAAGLELHLGKGRGFLPSGLIEEIRTLSQPPIPWDVELAQWLDQFFPPVEKRRSFARAHRRQSSSPDIPRPAWITPEEQRTSRVFGVVVDTSGSMSRADLGKAIGAIASYAMSRDAAYVRLIQCDAAPYDSGYLQPEDLLHRIQVRGRGGTVLMPGIRLLEEAADFPSDGPVLVITDGICDVLKIRRQHAFL
ncbi:MAG: VWA-like domain-containing protein, partial [Pseudomonadota bacterium]